MGRGTYEQTGIIWQSAGVMTRMEMAAVLLQVLERAELNKLPKGAQNKLEKFVADLQNANEALKTQHERFTADSDQQYFEIEKRWAESQERTLSATRDLQTLKEENKKLSEFSLLSCCILSRLTTNKAIGSIFQTKAKYEIEAEKREMARLLEKSRHEVENLTEDVKRLNEKLTETSKVKMELQLKLDDIQSFEVSVQQREKRMEQEKELLENKIGWLTAELKTKTEEVLEIYKENGKEILELQGNLKNSIEQVTSLQSQLNSLKETSESHRRRAEDLNNKLKQAKDEQSAMEEKYHNELNAYVKLSSLYKGTAKDTDAKNQELSRAVEELSKLVKDTGEANKALERKVSEGETLKTQLEAELREKIKKMEKELENATWCVCVPSLTEEQLDSMCPSAAAIAAIVKPGMKFFDLYNAYAECQTQLQMEKQETRRVSRVLDEIIQEVESKAPVLKRQREEYESMQRSMATLCNKLQQAQMEIYNLQKEKEESKQCSESMEKEKVRMERQLEHTSTQLCTLLLELEKARGNQVTRDDSSTTSISSTSEVINPHHLPFHSVEELQRQNQSLLIRLRELEGEKDRQQNQVTSKLQKEVEQLREQRNQQRQLADSSARQRDMYKALLTQSTGFSIPLEGDTGRPPLAEVVLNTRLTHSTPQRATAAESETAQAKAALKQLNDAFTVYKKEKAENDRMLSETNDKLQKQLTELRSSHAKLMSRLEFSNKRYEMLQDTVSAFRREVAALQDRNQKMTTIAQRYEHSIHTMTQDLRRANQKLAMEEVRIENLTKERDMLRQAENRLLQEKETMLAAQRNQNLLLTNLKSIQLTMERTETDTRQRLNSKIEHLEAELASMKTKLDQEVVQRHSLGRSMDAQLLEAKKELETQNTLQQKTRELLRTSEQQVAALKALLASASSPEVVLTTPSISATGLCKIELAEHLKNANAIVEQYRAMVLTLEDNLKKEKEVQNLSGGKNSQLKESEEVQKQLDKRILEMEKMRQQEQEQKRKAIDELEKQVSLKHTIIQVEQQEALERAAVAVTLEQKAIQDSLLQKKLSAEAQAKYERELMLHAADVEALQELKKRSQQEAAQKRELEEQVKKISSLLQEKSAAWNIAERHLKDMSRMSCHCTDVEKQNALLHQQLDEMGSRSHQVLQQQMQLDLSFSEEEKTSEQILEILRFVRREKEIAVAQCEVSEEQVRRHIQRVEHQDRELKELKEALNAERVKMQTLAQQEEQLKKMETIGFLQETNKMLKVDRDKLEQELQQAQARVTKLQSDISPLHNSLSVLSEKNGSLQADKRILEEDLKRWKAKTQQLISQQKDSDTDERQKIASEREAQQKRIAQLVEETAKLKIELASNLAQNQLQGLRDSMTCVISERDKLNKELENKNSDILDKNKTITQVKKIGRRYKNQFEEIKAQHDKTHQSSQESHNQEVSNLNNALNQAEMVILSKKSMTKNIFQRPFSQDNDELKISKDREEQLRQQIAEKEEKTKKVFMGAKIKINQLNSAKERLSQEVEELKQCKEELEVRLNALKSQYEGRLLRLDRELRDLRETQAHSEPREEPQDQSGVKVQDQRQLSLKSPAQERGSSTLSEPPTANIRPTQSGQSPSNKPSPSSGSKATPRASIRPMVTPAAAPVLTPTATVMPTTQTDRMLNYITRVTFQHIIFSSLVTTHTSITQPASTQATAFVQPTQQQAANQDPGASTETEWPSTSSTLIGPGEQDLVALNALTGSNSATSETNPQRDSVHLAPAPSSLTPCLTHPRRPPHPLPPRLYIQPPAPELGSLHTQVKYVLVTWHFCVLQQHFFDDDDRMVPSTPTLVVPHRTDGFAEAIHSPQVAGLSTRFRFGPPEDLLPPTSASHSDLGQLASQGGLGLYESPLFLAAHDEEGGGRSVPTTPLQVAAPVTVFTESLPSDSGDNMASQSVPMVTASSVVASAADDGDEVFDEREGESPSIESSLESQTDMESSGQQSEDTSVPSTSQDPGNFLSSKTTSDDNLVLHLVNMSIWCFFM
uniref:Uncharacterized protein n=1 Tax=Mola mola TaxID=94237 RepID=A0A3Q3XS22_MOLML